MAVHLNKTSLVGKVYYHSDTDGRHEPCSICICIC